MNKEEIFNDGENIIYKGINQKGNVIELNIDENTEVIINGVLMYSKHPEEEYNYIPPTLRDYIKKESYSMLKEKEQVFVEMFCGGNDITAYFPFTMNNSDGIRFRFTTIVSPMDMDNLLKDVYLYNRTDDINEIMANVNSAWEKMINKINDTNLKFEFSHDMGEGYYGWWDIIWDYKESEPNKLTICGEAISEFNSIIKKLEKEYSILN